MYFYRNIVTTKKYLTPRNITAIAMLLGWTKVAPKHHPIKIQKLVFVIAQKGIPFTAYFSICKSISRHRYLLIFKASLSVSFNIITSFCLSWIRDAFSLCYWRQIIFHNNFHSKLSDFSIYPTSSCLHHLYRRHRTKLEFITQSNKRTRHECWKFYNLICWSH